VVVSFVPLTMPYGAIVDGERLGDVHPNLARGTVAKPQTEV